MSRAVIYESFGGPEVLEVREVPVPHAGPREVRVRVGAAGLNPMDVGISFLGGEVAAQFGITLPSGFGYDFAGAIDEVGAEVEGFAVGDRVYGGAMGRAVADFVVMNAKPDGHDHLFRTPDGISDDVAATLPVAGRTATAALATSGVVAGDTVLVGGAAGGVGVFVVQLARLDGARVIGTCSQSTFGFVRELGAEPVTYGPGLAERVLALNPEGITAAIDLFGLETAQAALRLGVPPERICTIAAGPNPPGGVRPTWGWDAPPDTEHRINAAITAGRLDIPIAAIFDIEQIREAADLLGGRHVHGKILVKP